MVPIVGVAHIGYIPKKRVVGISKLARLVIFTVKASNSRDNDSSNSRYHRKSFTA